MQAGSGDLGATSTGLDARANVAAVHVRDAALDFVKGALVLPMVNTTRG